MMLRSIEQTLIEVRNDYQKWKKLLDSHSTATQAEEFRKLTEKLKQDIEGIFDDLQDLEETIHIVEQKSNRFQIDKQEIENRKKFVTTTKEELQKIKDKLNSEDTKLKIQFDQRSFLMMSEKRKVPTKFERLEEELVKENQEFIENEQQKQEQIYKQQDQQLDQLEDTVIQLGEVGKQINVTVKEQIKTLEEFEQEMDDTTSRMSGATRQVTELAKKVKENGGICVIVFLLVVLIVLGIIAFRL